MPQDSEKLNAPSSNCDLQVDVKPKCPHCGHGEIRFRADAWEVRVLRGFDDDGEPVLDEPDYEVFDDAHFECDRCSHKCSDASDFYREPAA